MQYGQNISIPYSQPQSDLNFLNAAAAGVDHKGKIHPKIERDREEGKHWEHSFKFPKSHLLYSIDFTRFY